MFKKILSSVAGISLVFSFSESYPAEAMFSGISAENILEEQQTKKALEISSIPVNDSIKDLDENIIKIMIDPGHYDHYNQSPVYSPYWESIMTWKLSNYLQRELQALGVHADLTKSSLEEDPLLNDRGFGSKGYDFFISVHSNAGAYESMDQPLAFCYQNLPWTTIDDTSRELGGLLAEKISDVMQTNQKGGIAQRAGTGDWDNNGIIDDEWYSVLFGARFVGTPGILLEHSFHTNYRATLWLYNDENLKTLAREEAEVIYDYFSQIKPQNFTVGDVNGDGMINAVDASNILSAYADISTGTETILNRNVSDVNGDGMIDALDATQILMIYAELSTE